MQDGSDQENCRSSRDREYLLLLGKHEMQLAACIHAIVPAWHDAEDIFQETKIRLWEQFDKYQPGTDFGAWACTIARYLAKAYFKQQGRARRLLDDDVLESVLVHVAVAPPETSRRMEALRLCLAQLGGEALDLLDRRYFRKQNISTIAAELRRSLPGTYSALSRIRRALLDCVRDRLSKEESA